VKRFWTAVAVVAEAGGWAIALDGKPLKTPARAPLMLPNAQLAEAVAAEWSAAGAEIDPAAMPLTGLANAAIDHVAPDPRAFAAGIAGYAEADLACYRAEGPSALVELQSAAWDALLAWARRRFDVDFNVTTGLTHIAQPPATVERLAHEVRQLGAFELAALSPLVTIGGSLVAALGVVDEALTDLYARVARGELRAVVGATYPLSRAADAQVDLAERRTTGKLLLDPTA